MMILQNCVDKNDHNSIVRLCGWAFGRYHVIMLPMYNIIDYIEAIEH